MTLIIYSSAFPTLKASATFTQLGMKEEIIARLVLFGKTDWVLSMLSKSKKRFSEKTHHGKVVV
jgi:hypothetical protein